MEEDKKFNFNEESIINLLNLLNTVQAGKQDFSFLELANNGDQILAQAKAKASNRGTAIGSLVGSIIPGLGTAIGGGIGGLLGNLLGGGKAKKDIAAAQTQQQRRVNAFNQLQSQKTNFFKSYNSNIL